MYIDMYIYISTCTYVDQALAAPMIPLDWYRLVCNHPSP